MWLAIFVFSAQKHLLESVLNPLLSFAIEKRWFTRHRACRHFLLSILSLPCENIFLMYKTLIFDTV